MSADKLRNELNALAERAATEASDNTADSARTLALHNDMVRHATGVDSHADETE